MKSEQEIKDAKSIKDIEDENYRTNPLIIIDDTNKKEYISIYYPIKINGDEAVNTKTEKKTPFSSLILSTTRREIDNRINSGAIYEDPDGFTDYETLDEEFLQELKKQYLYYINKNSGQPNVNSNIIPLNTSNDIIKAINDMRSNGGLKDYEVTNNNQRLNITVKKGYLVSIEYDPTNKKYRAMANDGNHGLAYCSFSTAARTPRTIYIIDQIKLIFNGKNYVIPSNTDLSFVATY